MPNWQERFNATYEFVRVSREHWNELERVTNIKNGGTITRNMNTALYESAKFKFADSFNVGQDYLRAYLNASFRNGSTEHVCLGTFLPSVDDITVNGTTRNGQITAYGLLKIVQDDDFDGPYVIEAGTNIVDAVKKIIEGCGLIVIADKSDAIMSTTWVFGIDSGEDSDTKLDAVNKLLTLAGFRSAMTDHYGRVLLRKYIEPSNIAISRTLVEGASARFLPEMIDSTNKSEICNIVHVDFTAQDATVRGTAVDDNPDSSLSTVTVGRRIAKNYKYNSLPGIDIEDNNMLEGITTMRIGVGTAQDKTFRQSASGGTVKQVYVPDSPIPGIVFGMNVSSSAGERIGFCQDRGPSAKKNTKYTQSAWVKGSPGRHISFQPMWDADKSVSNGLRYFELTGHWQYLEFTVDNTEDRSNVSYGYIYMESHGDVTVVGLKVEAGDKATPLPQAAMQVAADKKAKELLDNERAIQRTVEFESVYMPIDPTDAIMMEYRSGKISGRHAIQKQTVTLAAGCMIKHTARRYER